MQPPSMAISDHMSQNNAAEIERYGAMNLTYPPYSLDLSLTINFSSTQITSSKRFSRTKQQLQNKTFEKFTDTRTSNFYALMEYIELCLVGRHVQNRVVLISIYNFKLGYTPFSGWSETKNYFCTNRIVGCWKVATII